jgi:predicted ATPase
MRSEEGTVDINSAGLALGEGSDVVNYRAESLGMCIVARDDDGAYSTDLEAPEERSLYLTVRKVTGKPPGQLVRLGPGFTYLTAERLGPRDVLTSSAAAASSLGVGVRGEYTAQVLAASERLEVRLELQHPETHSRGSVITLGKQLEMWTTDIIRPIEVQAEWFPNSVSTTLRFKAPGVRTDWMKPSNVGFGLSYGLPVILAALVAPVGGLFLIENPEAHLHPAGQSRLGAFLARLAGSGVQVVVETHSDHVINGMRAAVASDRTVDADDVVLLFLSDPDREGGPVEVIHVTPRGGLDYWPAGFFDQSEVDLARITRVRQ